MHPPPFIHNTYQGSDSDSSSYNYSPLLGACVILGLMAAACATSVTVLLTYLALIDRRCVTV